MITPQQVAAAAAERFSNGSDVAAFFEDRFHSHFIDWFNAHCASKGAWHGKALGSSDGVKARFAAFWNNIPAIFDASSISLVPFAALMSILIAEAGPECCRGRNCAAGRGIQGWSIHSRRFPA